MSASITIANARQLNPPDAGRYHFYDKTEMIDELFARIPFIPAPAETFQAPRIVINTLLATFNQRGIVWPNPATSNPADTLDTAGTTQYDPDIFTATLSGGVGVNQFALRRIAGQVDMNAFPDYALSGQNPQAMMQLETKLKALQYEWSDAFISGKGVSTAQFLGIDEYVNNIASSQSLLSSIQTSTFNTANAKWFMNELDIVMHKVRGGPDFILMNDAMIRFYLRATREVGYAPEVAYDPVLRQTTPTRYGVPILRNQFIPTVSSKQNIYFGRLGVDRGLVGLYPSNLPAPGINITTVGLDQKLDINSMRISWTSAPAWYSEGCVARLQSVFLPTEP